MEGYRTALRFAVIALAALCASGCRWLNPPPAVHRLPRVLPPTPRLEQVIDAVNQNSSRIYSFSTDEARLSVPGYPSLSAALAFERPRRFRLRAGTGILGPELDVGSNDELFWMWVRREPPMVYCRHDRLAASPVRHALPIEPEWLVEALGLSQFDPALPHQGPYARPGGRLEIRTIREAIDGPTTKITLVDGATGVVLEQHVYDARRQLVASALASGHRLDPLAGLIMPGVVEIHWPRAQFSMRLDLGNVRINRPLGNPAELWAMPALSDTPTVDLSDPNLRLAPPVSPGTPTAGLLPGLLPLGPMSTRADGGFR